MDPKLIVGIDGTLCVTNGARGRGNDRRTSYCDYNDKLKRISRQCTVHLQSIH